MRLIRILIALCILSCVVSGPASAHTSGASSIHEISSATAPSAKLVVTKDPTGGFNVQVQTSRFTWRPDMASMKHVEGEGHAHVYLDGQKIMRIYNDWFHLNTFQFATKPGEQLVSIELVGNDHSPYTTEGLPVGAEALVDVAADEMGNQLRVTAEGSADSNALVAHSPLPISFWEGVGLLLLALVIWRIVRRIRRR